MQWRPGGDRAALLLCGWREQGIQIVDMKSAAVTQTVEQPAAFIGLAFAPDGKMLYASGGNEDAIFSYRWIDGQAVAAGKSPSERNLIRRRGHLLSCRHRLSPDGRFLYAAKTRRTRLRSSPCQRKVVQRLATGAIRTPSPPTRAQRLRLHLEHDKVESSGPICRNAARSRRTPSRRAAAQS